MKHFFPGSQSSIIPSETTTVSKNPPHFLTFSKKNRYYIAQQRSKLKSQEKRVKTEAESIPVERQFIIRKDSSKSQSRITSQSQLVHQKRQSTEMSPLPTPVLLAFQNEPTVIAQVPEQPKIDLGDSTVYQSTRSLDLKINQLINLQKSKDEPILCDQVQLNRIEKPKRIPQRQTCSLQIDSEWLKIQGQQLIRKVVQIILTNREKEGGSEQKLMTTVSTMKESQYEKQFSHVLTQSIIDERSPKGKDKEQFFQQLSHISRGQSMIPQNLNYSDSLKPLRSLVDAIKEVPQAKPSKMKLMSGQQKEVKKIRISVNYENETSIVQLDYAYPQYIAEQDIQLAQSEESAPVKEVKPTNIYSLVSKSLLTQKYGSKLIKIGKQVQQTYHEEISPDEFNKNTSQQYTRYYIQNNILRTLNKQYDYLIKSEQQQEQFVKSNTTDYLNTGFAVTKLSNEFSQNNKEYKKHYQDIGLNLYCIQADHQYDLHSRDMEDDSYIIESQQNQTMKLITPDLSEQRRIDTEKSKKLILRVIVNQIDEQGKNILLHQQSTLELNTVEQVFHSDLSNPNQLAYIDYYRICLTNRDKRYWFKQQYARYDHMLLGPYEDNLIHFMTLQEREFILSTLKNNASTTNQDNSLKVSEQHKTVDTLVKQNSNKQSKHLGITADLNINKTRSQSPSQTSEAPTNKLLTKRSQRNILSNQRRETKRQSIILVYPPVGKTASFNTLAHVSSIPDVKMSSTVHQKQSEPNRSSQNLDQKQVSQQSQQIANQPYQQQQTFSTPIRKMDTQFQNQSQSMDPFSLLFRNMMRQQSVFSEKTLVQKLHTVIEQHKLMDFAELLKHESGFNINQKYDGGNTLLIVAAKCGSTSIVKYLLQNGADDKIVNNMNQNALDVALENYQFDTADEINRFERSYLSDTTKLY